MFFLNSLVARQHNSKMVCTFANHLLRHSVYRDYWILMVGEVIDIKITVIPWRLKNNYSGYVTTKECYNERMLQRTMLQRTKGTTNYATTNECYNEQFLSIKSGCYNERLLMIFFWLLSWKVRLYFSLRKDCLCFSNSHVQYIKVN